MLSEKQKIQKAKEFEVIEDLYVNKKMSGRMIAKITGISKSSVAYKLKNAGISRNKQESVNVSIATDRFHYAPKGEHNQRYIHGRTLDKNAGIYALYKNNKLMYIGKSLSSMEARISRHFNDESKDIDLARCFTIENDANINLLEMYLIGIHKPPYNIDSVGNSVPTIEIDFADSLVSEVKEYTYNSVKKCPCMEVSEFIKGMEC